jgi:hypothetical protein
MADEGGATEPRVRGEAAWKAARDETERRNAAVKRRAQEHQTSSAAAALERDRRLAVLESAQLQALNEQMGTRAGGRHDRTGTRGVER